MRCPSCQHENADAAKFCGRCGQTLAATVSCPACGSENPPSNEFCNECGRALGARPVEEPEKPAPDAERRHLTVLSCDLVDSTRLAASLDPEDWREVVRGYQQAAAGVVERFAGHVAQYLGDGLLVYFGYPRAHEDDAERAVRAGLGIVEVVTAGNEVLQATHGLCLAVRIGIHTGPVVVGEMGGGASRETLAMGDTTNVAARIEGEADPDTVVLSSATLRLVSGIFVTEDLGERALKGTGEVHLHRALRTSGIRSRLDVAAATGLTPLVGRDQELGLLEDRFAQVAEGLGQAVLVSGEAGIGKSRLVQAFRDRIAERAHSWLECRCSPYTQDSALFPVLELQRQGLGSETPAEVRLERLEGRLERAGFDLAQALPLMASFHGLPLPERYQEPVLSPEGRRKKTLELLVEWPLRLGQLQPLVLLMEDLHWVDPSTQELIGELLERIPREQVLLLATYRPDFEAPWGARSHVTPMLLARLTRAQLRDLIRKAARERDLPDVWVEEIALRSDGVPLFAEELTKAVLESNPELPEGSSAPELRIPETLQDSLMARLDALGPVKELAQLGAVLGREFSYDLLLRVSPLKQAQLEPVLAEAVREELFYQRGVPPDATYLFKHALTRDAAYQSLLRAARQRHHHRVAETLIDQMLEVAEAQPELVAHHLTEAGDAQRAVAWWQRAGEQANARVAHEEAIRHVRRGLSLIAELAADAPRDEAELALQVALAQALLAARGMGHPETVAAWERARALSDPSSDPTRSAAIRFGLTVAYVAGGDIPPSLESAQEVLRIGHETRDELLVIAGHRACEMALNWAGRFVESRQHLERAISLYDPSRHRFLDAGFYDELSIGLFGWAGLTYWHLGFPDRAQTAIERSIGLARELQQPFGLAFTLSLVCPGVALLRGDWEGVRAMAAEATHIAEEQGFPALVAFADLMASWAAGFGDRAADAVERCTSAIARAAPGGSRAGMPLFLGLLAELQLLAGRSEDALGAVNVSLAVAEQGGAHFRDAELHRLKAECFLKMEDHTDNEAETLFRKAIEIAQSQEAKSLELRAATSLARLWQRQGKKDEAHALLQPVYHWFTEGFDTQDLQDAKALLEELG